MFVNPVSLGDEEFRWTGFFIYIFGAPGLLVQVFIEYLAIDAWEFASAPGPFGDRGDTPRWGPMAGTAACCTQYMRCCPFFPVQPQSTELPATTKGRWRRRHLSPGHKAGLWTVLLTCTGCAFQGTPGVEKGVTL